MKDTSDQPAKPNDRFSLVIPPKLRAKIKKGAKKNKSSEAKFVRDTLETALK